MPSPPAKARRRRRRRTCRTQRLKSGSVSYSGTRGRRTTSSVLPWTSSPAAGAAMKAMLRNQHVFRSLQTRIARGPLPQRLPCPICLRLAGGRIRHVRTLLRRNRGASFRPGPSPLTYRRAALHPKPPNADTRARRRPFPHTPPLSPGDGCRRRATPACQAPTPGAAASRRPSSPRRGRASPLTRRDAAPRRGRPG